MFQPSAKGHVDPFTLLQGNVMSLGSNAVRTVGLMVLGIGLMAPPSASASPPVGGGGWGNAGNWVNFGIGAANAINQSRQHPNHQPHPQYQQHPQYQPAPAPKTPVQANVIPEKKVEPIRNVAPLANRIVPLRKREARCYQNALGTGIDDAGQRAETAWQQQKQAIGQQLLKGLVGTLGADATREIADLLKRGDFLKVREQLDGLPPEARVVLTQNLDALQKVDQQVLELRSRLRENPQWEDLQKSLEDLMASISQVNQRAAANPQAPAPLDGMAAGLGGVANLLIIRDILDQALNADGPAVLTPVPVTGIPTGIIRVIYDPELPVGTGLRVTDTVLIAGTGGRGELQTGIASAAAALGLPVAPGEPLAALGNDQDLPKGGILINNPHENSGAIKYVLASTYPVELKTGYWQHLPGNQNMLIEFDKGASFGKARYTLTKGIFDFKVGDKGWEMVMRPLNVVIDNRDGQHDFHYVEDNTRQVVKAGESKTIENQSPVIIAFDNGKDAPAKKMLNKSGTYKVAVDISTNRYDLFAMAPPESKSNGDASAVAGE